jgi:hypothetical protein
LKNEGLGFVEGLPPFEMVEEPARIFSVRGAGDMGAPTTWDSFAPTIGRERDRKNFG